MSTNSTPCINSTCGTPSEWIATKIGIIVFIIITAVLGNLLASIAILNERRMRTATNILLLNLALLDFLTALGRLPLYLINIVADRYYYGVVWCNIHSTISGICFIGSIYTLMFISYFRYRIICRSTTTRPKRHHAIYVSIFVWLWSTFVALWPILGWSANEFNPVEMACIPTWSVGISGLINGILEVVIDFLLPFSIIIFCYIRIYIYLKKKRPALKSSRSKRQSALVTRTMGIVILAFVLCYAPWSVIVFIVIPFGQENVYIPTGFYFITTVLVFINSSINPVIYGFQIPQFRQQYRRIICPCKKSNMITPSEGEPSSIKPRTCSHSGQKTQIPEESFSFNRRTASESGHYRKSKRSYVMQNQITARPMELKRSDEAYYSDADNSAAKTYG
ncbi:uncharacterized protein TRIADDRAFT_58699 [Trichoplax adhaerens]|uniref:G-protein coupled receptors family 1 profile domain-containing protein n=1 Tax=Trichoplax adhaerens TaxID=10228 RepID=B3S3F5_TRIAD|nr:hypothetical protein TRIADDRAFT_58699 [Trichoplax adhaerens]EDV22958.1 hypothetical protein TRIADDRAFT_58699 [Trichoplax adhaerens]|eukprot:XP_002114824.1 hypothetical protein TRIADDRAFT_58699 [Trichoplax adhaerens]